MRTEEIEQHEQQRHDDGDNASLRPVIYTREVDQRLIPSNKEHFAYRGNLVDGLAACKLEIEVDVLISRREQTGTLIVEHRLGNIVCTIVGIAEIVVNLGRGTILEQLFVVADSLLVVALLVFGIGIVLGDCRYRRSAEAQHRQEQPYEGISGRMLLGVLASRIDCIFYFHNRCHCRFEGTVHIAGRIAWSITLELALIESGSKLLYCNIVHIVGDEFLTDILTRELLYRHVQLVAHISPEGTHHLIIELALLALQHQLVGHAQTLGGYLARLVGALLHDVGILDGSAVEYHQQHEEGDERNEQTGPVAEASEEHIICLML